MNRQKEKGLAMLVSCASEKQKHSKRPPSRVVGIAATAGIIMAACLACGYANASPVFITDFDKNNNIYTNLNQQFPSTGSGTPGSGTGVANASFLFDPQTFNPGNPNNLNYVGNNGINFQLTSNALGQDFAQVGAGAGFPLLSLAINVPNAQNVYLLASAYDGTSFNITFTGSGGATETFSNVFLPDFNGGSINNTSANLSNQTVYRVTDVGAGGTGNSSNGAFNNYDLTEVGFTLDPQFAGQTLNQAAITSNGFETLILGATVTAGSKISAVPEASTWAMMLLGFLGLGFLVHRRTRDMNTKAAAIGA